jgi:hypothetical protein
MRHLMDPQRTSILFVLFLKESPVILDSISNMPEYFLLHFVLFFLIFMIA